MPGEVLLEIEGPVAVLTLAAPQRRNALTTAMVEELIAACDEIDANEAVGAAVIQSQGRSFCAGADRSLLAAVAADPASDTGFRDLGAAYSAFARVGELKVPTIAAVRGHAVGAGLNLVLATDLRIVAEGARLIGAFLSLGIHPGGGHFTLLGRLASRETVAAMSIFGEEISGRRAAELGIAWEAVAEDAVEPRALELAHRGGVDPPLSRATIRSMRTELGPPALPWPAALEMERAVQMWSLQRRPPQAS